LIEALHEALEEEGAVEQYPDPDSLPEQFGIRLRGSARLASIADAILGKKRL
jgi:hypothetical protein